MDILTITTDTVTQIDTLMATTEVITITTLTDTQIPMQEIQAGTPCRIPGPRAGVRTQVPPDGELGPEMDLQAFASSDATDEDNLCIFSKISRSDIGTFSVRLGKFRTAINCMK